MPLEPEIGTIKSQKCGALMQFVGCSYLYGRKVILKGGHVFGQSASTWKRSKEMLCKLYGRI
jgi:hypothetical protein